MAFEYALVEFDSPDKVSVFRSDGSLVTSTLPSTPHFPTDAVMMFLGKLGAEGWDLVILTDPSTLRRFVFKRQTS